MPKLIHRYRGKPDLTVTVDDFALPLEPSLKVSNHSPAGFNWGYGGSGPAQLALAILLFEGLSTVEARQLHQQFKWDVVSRLRAEWALTSRDVWGWIRNERARLIIGDLPLTFE